MIYSSFKGFLGTLLFILAVPFMLGTLACGEIYVALSAASDWCFGCRCGGKNGN